MTGSRGGRLSWLLAAIAITQPTQVFAMHVNVSPIIQAIDKLTENDFIFHDIELSSVFPEENVHVQLLVNTLVNNGYFLDIATVAGQRTVQCGEFSLPLDDDGVIAHQRGTALKPDWHTALINIDEGCIVKRIRAARVAPPTL